MSEFQTIELPDEYDHIAPDGSEIRELPTMQGGGLAHCTLPTGSTSLATVHKSVDEIWYFMQGQGEVWRKQDEREECVVVGPGLSLTIPSGTHFQFRNTGQEPLCIIIATMPPWPGEQESVRVQPQWPVN